MNHPMRWFRTGTILCLGLLTARTAAAEHDWPLEPGAALAPSEDLGCHTPLDLGVAGYVDCRLGLVLECVPACSLAARLGLEPGDVILRINGRRIRCDADYTRGLADAARCGVLKLLVIDVRSGGLVPIVYRPPGGRRRRWPLAPFSPAEPSVPGIGFRWGSWGGPPNVHRSAFGFGDPFGGAPPF